MLEHDFQYHAPLRNWSQIERTVRVGRPVQDLWGVFTTRGHFKMFHPYCKAHEKKQLSGIGDRDRATFYNGKTMRRVVIEWDEGHSYTIKMDNDDGIDTRVRFCMESQGKSRATCSVRISTDAYRKIPRPIWGLYARFLLFPTFKKYLSSLLSGLDYFLRTGKPVKKNQFGRHWKFSP